MIFCFGHLLLVKIKMLNIIGKSLNLAPLLYGFHDISASADYFQRAHLSRRSLEGGSLDLAPHTHPVPSMQINIKMHIPEEWNR